MDNDIIYQSSSATPLGVNFPALSPFSAMTHQELARIISPPSFPQVESGSNLGLRWIATGIITSTDHGTYKLFLCQRKGLAMWVPTGEWFYSNQTNIANQTIAQYAEKHLKAKNRPKPYDRPIGGFRIPRIRKDVTVQTPDDGCRHNMGISMETNPKTIRAEQLLEQKEKKKQVKNDLPSLHPPPFLQSNNPVVKQKSSQLKNKSPKTETPKTNRRWLAFKAKKKAAKEAAKTSVSAPPPHADVQTSEKAKVSSQTQIEPEQQQPLVAGTIPSAQGDPLAVFSTANGSTISFGDFQPLFIDDIDELNLLEDI